jgi:hypothetical protein
MQVKPHIRAVELLPAAFRRQGDDDSSPEKIQPNEPIAKPSNATNPKKYPKPSTSEKGSMSGLWR